jgi:hypothetical protein
VSPACGKSFHLAATVSEFAFLARSRRRNVVGHPSILKRNGVRQAALFGVLGIIACPGWAQGPTPETGNTIFPGGGLASYAAEFVSRKAPPGVTASSIPPTIFPTLGVSQPLLLSWGIRRDLELTAITSINTNWLNVAGSTTESQVGGTGLGDSLLLLKYRFLRRDSERGTTQASVVMGPKLPTGRTDLRDPAGALLPVTLQPGTGSLDLFASMSATYTGLLHVEKLVADGTVDYLLRTQGAERTQLGNSLYVRLYLPYRPYESHSVGKEWWIGPELAWEHEGYIRIGGVRQPSSGGEVLSAGAATYFSPSPGLELWFGIDFPVAQQWNGTQDTVKRHISIGISKQFEFHH